jgi:hypothetical protein
LFESQHLSDCGLGWPLLPLIDHIDNLAYTPVDGTGETTVSHTLENELSRYISDHTK